MEKLVTRKTNWITAITTNVNQLTQNVTKVPDTIQDETYGASQADALAAPIILPPLRIEMPTEELSKKGKGNEESLHKLDTLILNFSKLTFLQIYSIQQAAAAEIRT